MTHDLATFDLQILRPIHSATQRLCGYVVRIKGACLVHAVMRLEDCSEILRFRAFLLEQGSFHFWMSGREWEEFLTRCINAAESQDSILLEDAPAEVQRLNVQPLPSTLLTDH